MQNQSKYQNVLAIICILLAGEMGVKGREEETDQVWKQPKGCMFNERKSEEGE